ncbi:MAG TPA: NADH-quinone oxidoreductase subunit L [Edaphocola sp.]|nr:NADH-quinone oxidoreductase subunit L [Edaphocola sp.]
MKDLIYLVPLLPLVGFLINGLFWKSMPKNVAAFIGNITVLGSFVIALLIFFGIKNQPGTAGTVFLFDFIHSGSLSIPFAFQVDQLSSLFMLIITGVGFLIHLYSIGYMKGDAGFVKYFAYLNLFVFAMLVLVLANNLVVMYIGWEGVGLASYLLIGFWYKNKDFSSAGKKAFIMNRIGDLGFLTGVFLTLYYFGSATYSEVFTQLAAGTTASTGVLNAIGICLFIGAMGKSAQIPLYTWLPDAMAGPTPVSALIHAATMVTAGVYLIARSHILYNMAPAAQTLIAITGVATAVFAASIALKQYDIKKVLAYSTVSQLGYMFLALGVGSYFGGIFHVLTHAFFKALLFLGAGSVIHAMGGEQDLRKMGGLGKYMRITQITFLIACLAIAGIPGFSGFFSKDEILAAAYAKNPIYYYLGLLGALMTAFYMFRIYFYIFTGKFRGTEEQKKHLHESPATMTFPLLVLAVLSIAAGYIGLPKLLAAHNSLHEYLSPVLSDFHIAHLSESTEWLLMGLTGLLVVIMIAWVYLICKKAQFKENTGLAKALEDKWYIDEIYQTVFEKPILALGRFFDRIFDRKVVDGLVNGVGRMVIWSSGRMRLLQNGQVGFYFFGMVIGIVLLMAVGLLLVH